MHCKYILKMKLIFESLFKMFIVQNCFYVTWWYCAVITVFFDDENHNISNVCGYPRLVLSV